MEEQPKTLQLSPNPDSHHHHRVLLYGLGALFLIIIAGGLGYVLALKNVSQVSQTIQKPMNITLSPSIPISPNSASDKWQGNPYSHIPATKGNCPVSFFLFDDPDMSFCYPYDKTYFYLSTTPFSIVDGKEDLLVNSSDGRLSIHPYIAYNSQQFQSQTQSLLNDKQRSGECKVTVKQVTIFHYPATEVLLQKAPNTICQNQDDYYTITISRGETLALEITAAIGPTFSQEQFNELLSSLVLKSQ